MAFMTRVAVETLVVSSSWSECMVSGSRFTVSTLMSSFLRVTSLRPGMGEAAGMLSPSLCWPFLVPQGRGACGPHFPVSPACLPGSRAVLTAFAASVEKEQQGDEEEDEQDAGPDGGPGDDTHGQHLFRQGKERVG